MTLTQTMALEIRVLGRDGATALRHVAPGVFDGPVEPRWSAEFFADARHHLAVAIDDGEVVGMASGVHYVHPDKPPELWINEVAVAPARQGNGIGRRLLDALLAHGRALGCRDAWVLTDRPNPRRSACMKAQAERRSQRAQSCMSSI